MPLPADVERVLGRFVEQAERTLRADLVSVVLFGSAAEDRLRLSSDVNVMLVLTRFDRSSVAPLREHADLARATIALRLFVVLESELHAAAEAFAVKFADMAHRRRVLRGRDPFETLTVPRAARVRQLQQSALNMHLRLRGMYLEHAAGSRRLLPGLADLAGPLRVVAATLQDLEGRPREAPREALVAFAASSGDERLVAAVGRLSRVREELSLPAAEIDDTLAGLIDVAALMCARASHLDDRGGNAA